jgi:dolichol-phosphate mannosyltransferase
MIERTHYRPAKVKADHGLAASSPESEVARGRGATPQVCVLVPTRNEAGNIAALLERLGPAVAWLDGEVLFVDDSDDDTPSVIAAARRKTVVPVRLLHRDLGERPGGLGGAVQAGMATVTAPWTVVMDGDLQHPPERVAGLVAAASDGADLIVASRYCSNGSARGLSSRFRNIASGGATVAARLLFPRTLTGVTDPMSGFFAFRTAAVDPAALRPRGFKVLLEVLARTPSLRVTEVPFEFAERYAGQSKASWREAAHYLRKLVGLRAATAAGGRRNHVDATGVPGSRHRMPPGAGADMPHAAPSQEAGLAAGVKPARTAGS